MPLVQDRAYEVRAYPVAHPFTSPPVSLLIKVTGLQKFKHRILCEIAIAALRRETSLLILLYNCHCGTDTSLCGRPQCNIRFLRLSCKLTAARSNHLLAHVYRSLSNFSHHPAPMRHCETLSAAERRLGIYRGSISLRDSCSDGCRGHRGPTA